MFRRKDAPVGVGDRFRVAAARVCDARPSVWEVVALHAWQFGPQHAEMIRLGDPLDRKSVSVAALADRTLFVPVEGMAAE